MARSLGSDYIGSIGFFDGVSQPALARIRRELAVSEFPPGSLIVAHTDAGHDVFLLISGTARVALFSADGRKISFRKIEVGDLFGELAAIDRRPRSASVEAIAACRVAKMPVATFWRLIETEPAFAASLLKHLAQLNRTLTDRIYEFSTLAVNNRIHAELLRMAEHTAAETGRTWIDPAPTHEDIASRISTHREAVSREISRLKRLGILKGRRRALVITDVARLRRMVSEAVED